MKRYKVFRYLDLSTQFIGYIESENPLRRQEVLDKVYDYTQDMRCFLKQVEVEDWTDHDHPFEVKY